MTYAQTIGQVLRHLDIQPKPAVTMATVPYEWYDDDDDWAEYYAEFDAEMEYMEVYGFCEDVEEGFGDGKRMRDVYEGDYKEARKIGNRQRSWKKNSKARFQFQRHGARQRKKEAFGRVSEVTSKSRRARQEVLTPYEELRTEEKPERFSNDPRDASFWERACFNGGYSCRAWDLSWDDPVEGWRTEEEYCYGSRPWFTSQDCECFKCGLKRWQHSYLDWVEFDMDFSVENHNPCHGFDYGFDDYNPVIVTRHAPDPIKDEELEPEDIPQFRRSYLKARKPSWAA